MKQSQVVFSYCNHLRFYLSDTVLKVSKMF